MKEPTRYKELAAECLAFCELAGITRQTFGQKVLKERKFIDRLLAGGRCWPETEAKVREFIARETERLSA